MKNGAADSLDHGLGEELAKYRPQLLKYAMQHLRNPSHAEDAVQETLVAALTARGGFEGRSNVRTWLVGILKHKIVDHIRRDSREVPLEPDDEGGGAAEALFDEDGHWRSEPAEWGDPETALARREFFEQLERCLEGLPKKTARAFMLREAMGLSTEEICKTLDVTQTHCWVMLYRARMHLRGCLDKSWFSPRHRGCA